MGSWNPEFTICPFRARKWPFQAPKTLRSKGKMANFEAKNTVKHRKKRQKDKWYPFHANPPAATREGLISVHFGSVWLRFWAVLGPFRVRFGVLDGVGVGRGGVAEGGFWDKKVTKSLGAKPSFSDAAKSGCRKKSAAKGVQSLFSFSGHFRSLFGHFSDASVTFFVTFLPNSSCRTPFAAG